MICGQASGRGPFPILCLILFVRYGKLISTSDPMDRLDGAEGFRVIRRLSGIRTSPRQNHIAEYREELL